MNYLFINWWRGILFVFILCNFSLIFVDSHLSFTDWRYISVFFMWGEYILNQYFFVRSSCILVQNTSLESFNIIRMWSECPNASTSTLSKLIILSNFFYPLVESNYFPHLFLLLFHFFNLFTLLMSSFHMMSKVTCFL